MIFWSMIIFFIVQSFKNEITSKILDTQKYNIVCWENTPQIFKKSTFPYTPIYYIFVIRILWADKNWETYERIFWCIFCIIFFIEFQKWDCAMHKSLIWAKGYNIVRHWFSWANWIVQCTFSFMKVSIEGLYTFLIEHTPQIYEQIDLCIYPTLYIYDALHKGLCSLQHFLYEQRDCAMHISFMSKGIVDCPHFLYEQRDCAMHISFMSKGIDFLIIAHFLYEQSDCAMHIYARSNFMRKGIFWLFFALHSFLYEQILDCAMHISFMSKGILHFFYAQFLYEQRDCAMHISFMSKGIVHMHIFLYEQRDCDAEFPLWAKGLCNAHFLYEQRDCAMHISFMS